MEIKGYKTFNKDMTNRYGERFEVGGTYATPPDEEIKFGNDGNGFHFCERLEDTYRYFPALDEEVTSTEVTGSGTIVDYDDEYYGYYDMHASSIITIDRVLTREEIIDMYLDPKCPEHRVLRFLGSFRLTQEEIQKFLDLGKTGLISKTRYNNMYEVILYYQYGDTEVYNRKHQKTKTK